MSIILHREYPHLLFKKQWILSNDSCFILGQCDSLIRAINNTPIEPKYYQELMAVSFIKGAQATTAIEGNTLSEDEIKKIRDNEKLPPSKEYQEIEIKNILDAFYVLLNETILYDKDQLVCDLLLLRFHELVGKDLGQHFNAVPGRFRENDVTVGKYRCPDYRDVKSLIDQFCNWLRQEFRYEDGKQTIYEAIIQAIVAHIYIEWIHPFGDGNGRTGRLVEFYILLRAGAPNIALHILSNHYNNTRSEYYRQIEKATEKRDLSDFIYYALVGFRDGLQQTLEKIQSSQIENTWKKVIYDKFSEAKMGQKDVFKRKRSLALSFPMYGKLNITEIPKANIELAYLYSGITEKTLFRDLEELVTMDIIEKKDGKYSAHLSLISQMIALRRGLIPL